MKVKFVSSGISNKKILIVINAIARVLSSIMHSSCSLCIKRKQNTQQQYDACTTGFIDGIESLSFDDKASNSSLDINIADEALSSSRGNYSGIIPSRSDIDNNSMEETQLDQSPQSKIFTVKVLVHQQSHDLDYKS